MKILYFIFTDNEWKQVTYDEYHTFNGRKEIRPPHYGLILLHKRLVSLRWN